MAKKKGPRKGVEPPALKAYRLGKKNGKRSGGKRASGGGAKKKKSGKSRGVTQAAIISKPMNVAALAVGIWAGYEYRDDARLVKVLKNQKTRYAVMTAAGLTLGGSALIPVPAIRKIGAKIPEVGRAFLVGVGLGNGVALLQVTVPKLLPAPKAAANIGGDSSRNYGTRTIPGRSTSGGGGAVATGARREELRQRIAEAQARMNGRMPNQVMTGNERATMTGRGRFSSVWS